MIVHTQALPSHYKRIVHLHEDDLYIKISFDKVAAM